MSTFNVHQQSLADAGSETRPSILERAPRMQKEENLRGDDLKQYEAEIEAMNLILISILNDIYNSVDVYTTAKAMWQQVNRLMRGTVQNQVDRETRFNNKFDQFVAEPGEALVFVYNLDSYDDLFDYLQQFEKLVNASRAKKLEKTHDPLALVAHTGSSSRTTTPYYVTHPSSMVDYDDDYQGDTVQNNSDDPLTSAMILLAHAITRNFSNPTNNQIQDVHMFKRKSLRCYNYSEEGHDARNCPKPRVQDSKYFMKKMLLAKQDEAGVILTDEQNNFLFADASRTKEIKKLSANICLIAIIQPANIDSDAGPSYDSAFLSEADRKVKRFEQKSQSKYIRDRETIRDLEQQRDKLDLSVVELKRQTLELEKTQSILKRKMSENEDKYHDTFLDLEAKVKKNVDTMLKIGNSLQGMFMLGPKPMSYDSQSKHGLGYTNLYTLCNTPKNVS
ncbi:gag-pol polyprotein [Tanacetum coccineum]